MALQTTREDHRIAWLTALAISIHIVEAGLPSPLPGIKPGLANVVTLAVLLDFGWRAAAWVTLLRVLCGSLLVGTFLTPTFLLSAGGAAASVLAMGLATRLPGRGFGPIGYSLIGATAHMTGQFCIAYLLFIPHPALVRLLPILLTAALLFGAASGIIAHWMVKDRAPGVT